MRDEALGETPMAEGFDRKRFHCPHSARAPRRCPHPHSLSARTRKDTVCLIERHVNASGEEVFLLVLLRESSEHLLLGQGRPHLRQSSVISHTQTALATARCTCSCRKRLLERKKGGHRRTHLLPAQEHSTSLPLRSETLQHFLLLRLHSRPPLCFEHRAMFYNHN